MVSVSSPRLNRVRLRDSKSEGPLNRVRLHKWLLHLHPKSSSCPKSETRPQPKIAVVSPRPKSEFHRQPKIAVVSPRPKSEIRRQPKIAVVSPRSKSEFHRQPKIAVGPPRPRSEFHRQPKIAVFSAPRNPKFALNAKSPSSHLAQNLILGERKLTSPTAAHLFAPS